MKKHGKPTLLIILSGILLTSCGWSSEDKKVYMSECHAEMILGIGIIIGAEKFTGKDLSKNMNLDPISSCICSYDVAESLYSNYQEYKTDTTDKKSFFVAKIVKCNQK